MLLNRVVLQMRLCRLFAGFSEQDIPRILAGDVHVRVMSLATLHVSSEKGCMAVFAVASHLVPADVRLWNSGYPLCRWYEFV